MNDNILPCGHSSLSKITHVKSPKFRSQDIYYSCIFCDWRSDKPYRVVATLETWLKDLLHDYLGIILEHPTNEKEKKEIDKLVNLYAEHIRKYALQSFSSLGGQVKSEAKAKAARINGKKGGRPKVVTS